MIYPLASPYTEDHTTQFGALRSTVISGSALVDLSEVVNHGVSVIVGRTPCFPWCPNDHRRVDLVINDEMGNQTVVRLPIADANILSASLSKTLADIDMEGLSNAVEQVHDHCRVYRPGDEQPEG